MATARDLCRKILEASQVGLGQSILCRKILEASQVGLGQSIEGELLDDTLDYLNMELAFLNNKATFAPYESVFEETIDGGQSEYTIGTGGDIDLPRPISISWMKVLSGNTWFEMNETTQANFGKYSIISDNEIIPRYFYYEPTFPLGTIGFGAKADETRQYKIAIKHEIAQLGMNDTVALPTGYYPLLLWGTVARIPNVPNQIKMDARRSYDEMLLAVKIQNTESPRSRSSFQKGRKYNVRSDRNE